jgi:hypothetical protein
MISAAQPAPECWMSDAELADLEKDAGHQFNNAVEAHQYRLRRLRERLVASMLAHGNPLEELLLENAERLERHRHEATKRQLSINVVEIGFAVFEALKLQGFPPGETQKFLRMLDSFGKENPALLCLAEATRIRQWRGR